VIYVYCTDISNHEMKGSMGMDMERIDRSSMALYGCCQATFVDVLRQSLCVSTKIWFWAQYRKLLHYSSKALRCRFIKLEHI
jgi:hypothetical protein